MKEVNEMKSIKFNNKVVAVPAETIVEYLEYRKINKELEEFYSEGLNQAQDNLAQNIMIWLMTSQVSILVCQNLNQNSKNSLLNLSNKLCYTISASFEVLFLSYKLHPIFSGVF